MAIRFACLLHLGLFVQCSSFGQAPFKAPLAKLELENGDSIVFLGDSITHQCLYTQYVEDYFYTRFPNLRLKFHNAGVGGAKAWDALQRFDRDVAAYKPKYVTVLLGMNDGRYVAFDKEIFQTYHQDMTRLIERIKQIGATPILMTPTMYDSRAARLRPRPNRPAAEERLEFYNAVLAYYGSWLREVAYGAGFGFVDMYGPLNQLTLNKRQNNPEFTMIRDAVHPDPPGQLVMAFALLNDLNLPRPVSNIRILPAANGKPLARATGGKVSDFSFSERRVEFTWTANSLPWVVPDEAQLGAQLTRMGHRLSREALEVHGLKRGQYELSIDGDSVGKFSASALARHVELQSNPQTPQYRQALQVATLNKKRNDGPVKSLRNEWRIFQQAARLQATAIKPTAQNQLQKFEKQLQGQDQRIAEHQREALAIEDEIFRVNQPQPRKYLLQRVD